MTTSDTVHVTTPRSTPSTVARPTAWSAFRAVLRKELLLNLRDPLLLVMMFIFPIVLVALLSQALGGAFALGRTPDYVLVGSAPPNLTRQLGRPQEVLSLDAARHRVSAGDVQFAVITGDDGRVREVIADPTSQMLLPSLLSAVQGTAPRVVTATGERYEVGASPYAATLLGFVVYHAFFAASHAAQAMHRERSWGTWNRLLMLPLRRGWLLLAKMLPTAGIVTFQGLFLIGGGCLTLGVPIHNPLALLAACLLSGICVAALGALLAAVSRNDAQVPQLNNLLVLLGGTLGGALVPLAAMPSWVQASAPFTPQYWLVELLKGATSRGAGAGALLQDGSMVVVFAALLAGIGIATMRWHRFRHD
jgi:ABC-2 type transport system permease protein